DQLGTTFRDLGTLGDHFDQLGLGHGRLTLLPLATLGCVESTGHPMGVNQNIAKDRLFPAVLAALAGGVLLVCTPQRAAPARVMASYERASLPVLDVHTHLSADATEAILRLFDARGTRVAVNLSAGFEGAGLEDALAQQRVSNGRILPFCNLPW